MPPIKGRMMGLQQSKLDFRSIKSLGLANRKRTAPAITDGSTLPDGVKKDKALMKLRIPDDICRVLPSVRKFHPLKTANSGSKMKKENYPGDAIILDDDDEDVKPDIHGAILGLRRRRGEQNKYRVKELFEKSFGSMIWDLAFIPGSSDIVVSTLDGAYLCSLEGLSEKCKLENVILGGGISFLSNGQIVVVCRNSDIVNIYQPDGTFIRAFPAGKSPMCVAVNSKDNIIVTDTSTKSIRQYTAEGRLIRAIEPKGTAYQMKWPLYIDMMEKNHIVVVDCHMQSVYVFDFKGRYVRKLPLKTSGGNEVLRPHGVCSNKEKDLFIVDNAIDSVEVFHCDGSYLQTLVHSEEGAILKPKAVRTSHDGKHMIIGGLYGRVKLFKFLGPDEIPLIKVKEEKAEVIVID